MKHGKLSFEWNKITKDIYVGTNQCCIAHFEGHLVSKGVVADLSLEAGRLDAAWGAKYFLWLPVKDHTAPKLSQFLVGVNFLKQCASQKLKVYAHCQRGHGRAPTMVAAYLIAVKHLSPEKAVAFIKKQRPTIHPNKKQMAALRSFAAYVKKHKNAC